MGGLGKLSQFSGIKHKEPQPETKPATTESKLESESEIKSKVQESEAIHPAKLKSGQTPRRRKTHLVADQEIKNVSPDRETESIQNQSPPAPPSKGGESKIQNQEVQNQEKLVTVNIKITKSQKDWLAQTATQVRDNNTEPVPPAERVYPQHLIGVAIDLLKGVEVDWSQVKNVEDLREQLNL